jgi:hypothetical protein
MGNSISDPIPEIGFNYICVYLRQPNICRIMHATCNVVQAITNIVRLESFTMNLSDIVNVWDVYSQVRNLK